MAKMLITTNVFKVRSNSLLKLKNVFAKSLEETFLELLQNVNYNMLNKIGIIL